ncbi:type VI secretion system baseplate subunit TssG [Caballeronia sp. SEWSISQ10-4 2]|uniref:type VI secretion system baseplate subunit TssG n=1 Tax=Caballeronia sp. SEWSISQ10-4 2 TaxID=2937438 RepID=UPI0026501E10|nr:type VI secretion system baseplate subunit TssG [Caballeronia sp. SEWSISQ10-4 2]MDN7178991.1 type VI secretion system baseplate subunit TssG [Caballeronia sp. SEWSISQ10-4 2]
MEAMGADDRLPAAALIARLVAQPQGFDLFQAIHLLERAQPWARALGTGDGADEAVRLKGYVSLAFEASDIRTVRRHALPDVEETPRETYMLSTPVMTLAGANGPLPLPFTEMVLARRTAREPAMADLLDIFNHRFLSFLYRSRQKHAPGLSGREPDDAALAACLDALGNLGLHSGERGPRGARLWLRHAGLFGGAPHSLTGLLALLSDRLGVRVRGAQFVGGWREIDARDTLRLARAGARAPRLGGLAVLGRRSWDQAAGIRIEFLDLDPARFTALLPGGGAHETAAWLIRCYLQQDLDVQFLLQPGSPRAACTVGGTSAARLGWTSWLASRRGDAGEVSAARPAPVRLSLRAAAAVAPMRHT